MSPMLSSQAIKSAQECLIHPFEMFQASMDEYEYALCEYEIIHPSMGSAQSYTQLFNNSVLPNLPIVFAPGHLSSTDILCSWLILTIIDPCTTFAFHLWIQSQKFPPMSLP